MQKKSNEIQLIEDYKSVLQHHAILADTQNLIGNIGRGSGKTTEILSPRIVRVSYDMPRSIQLLAAPTYTFIIETIVPGLLNYLNKEYKKGIHFEYGKKPPSHFRIPYTEIMKWDHTISFAWGTVIQFISVDRPESAIGKNASHVFCDEMLRISETNFTERVLPTLRGDRQIFGNSPYFGGVTGFSSTPNFENDHDWWLGYEDKMNKEIIEEIMYVALRVMHAKYELKKAIKYNNQQQIKKHTRFINKWEQKLRTKRKGQTYFMKGSSLSNLLILGLEYIKNQYTGASIDKFKLSILGIRPHQVKKKFISKFINKHIYEDSYNYENISIHTIDGKYKKTSKDLKYCNHNRPLLAGWDPGYFMSIVIGQENNNELRLFKNLWVISPDQHTELAHNFNEFFESHRHKTLYLYYDRAGNQRNQRYRNNPAGETDAQIFKNEMDKLGWNVHLMSLGNRTIYYWEHYHLYLRLFGEQDKRTPRIRICQNECEQLISSINMSPMKEIDGQIELDKSSEKKLDYIDQIYWSPQIATAMMYLLFGKYEKWLPSKKQRQHYGGL